VKHVHVGERTTVLVDENRHGATVLDPPDRSTRGGEAPLVGLDATARPALWRLAVGERVDVRDIHRTPRERAEFLRDRLGLTVVRMSDQARAYEGDPSTKDTDGDVALVEALADDVSGVYGPRDRDGDAVEIGRPAVVTSKGVRGVLENDDRLDDVVAEYAHFGDLDGRNDLGDHCLAAFLGSPHYGDQYVEKMAALAGEEAVTDRDVAGRGMALNYGSDVANAALRGMREDRVMQGILRFTRGGTGAVVFARTAALRDDLPVRGEGAIARTYTADQRRVADTLRTLDTGRRYTAADVVDELGADAPSRRTVRRTLAAFANAGYVERERDGVGRAYEYRTVEAPGAGEVSVPDLPTPDKLRKREHYTPAVRVVSPDDLLDTGNGAVAPTLTRLPAPSSGGDPFEMTDS
jgi:DNA-binding transcriptional ArsR family regulator